MLKLIDKLPKIRGEYRENAKIKNWFNVGGVAEILFKPLDVNDLIHFLENCPKEIKITILGAASNVIIRDSGIDGVLIRLGKEFAKIYNENEFIIAGAASLCNNVALSSKDYELGGMEFLSGIPGSIGGAIAMNAGCYENDISQILHSATAIDYDGKIHNLNRSDFHFSYRKNNLASNLIFIEGKFYGTKDSKENISAKITELNKKREEAQPIRAKTGGSTFKNPSGEKKAWQLIDEAGFRGKNIGDAQFSNKHCNFLINSNNAKAQDLIDLGNEAKDKVKEKFGVNLEWEIKIIGKE